MSSTEVTFRDLGLADPILQALEQLGYETPTPIQSASITPLQQGKDLLGQAQTGTGKTGAFALPLLTRVDAKLNAPQILVLAPTRELAVQVAEAFQSYAKFLKGFHVMPIYGGQSMHQQLRQLSRGPQVIVGTPGRVMDHMRRGTLKLEKLRSVVLDEADEMLKMGFIDDIEWILDHTPEERQLALFSATMPDAIRRVANKHLNNPESIAIAASHTTVERIEQRFVQVAQNNKLEALSRVLEVEQTDGIIIFVRTRNSAVELAEKLEARGYAADALHGDMNQASRERAVDALKKGRLDILIATDVAARGLDVDRIEHVINYDIPYDTEAYVHRIGRTGRAGRSGNAILFVTGREMRMLRTIERATKSRIAPMPIPSPETVSERRLDRLGSQVAQIINDGGLDFMDAAVAKLCQQLEVNTDTLAAALLKQVQKARPLEIEPLASRPERGERKERAGRDGQDKKRRGGDRPAPDDVGDAVSLKDMPDVSMIRYQIHVGREHGVGVGNIVGAIANEADIDSRYIGQIEMYDGVSTVDLPDGMPKDVLEHLRKVRVCGQKLNIQPANSDAAKTARKESGNGGGGRGNYRGNKGGHNHRGGKPKKDGHRGQKRVSFEVNKGKGEGKRKPRKKDA
ncbi:DEAD/DEAH box helicase [Paraferrimonas haliotis]|uniref:ATP-dependent RNA helicase DeaD n=1 Tax=Paraferrimonas haliotis TaxID=2013866 RepID=A0AA37TQ61_9GAMM|nr:DEAD/DEAH box helicase [Paraferrimonas haliotis]GLS82317.1 ATP-dependent RNA helicase DeaD [Paraferrimonas haliotis]